MMGTKGFAEMAEEAEALAKAAVHPLVRFTFEMLARDYRAKANEGAEPPPDFDPVSPSARF